MRLSSATLRAVIFVLLVALVAAGVIIHAAGQRGSDGLVSFGPIQSESTSAITPPSVTTRSSSSPDPTQAAPPPPIPTPEPAKLKVGLAICATDDYTLKLEKPHRIDVTDVRYYVDATAKPGTNCLFIDYPVVTVQHVRPGPILNPSGGVITGFGRAPQLRLTPKTPARTFLQVTSGNCDKPTLPNLKLDGHPIFASLAKYCKVQESPWRALDDTSAVQVNSAGDVPTCEPYDLTLMPKVTKTAVAGATRYTMTVRNKREHPCVLLGFPPMSAKANGDFHELVVVKTVPYPPVDLAPGASATTYVQIKGTRCSGRPLRNLRVANTDVHYAKGRTASIKAGEDIVTFAGWCSLTEAYWQPVA